MPDDTSTHAAHAQFDALCASVEDYEPLPEVAAGPHETTVALSEQDQEDAIDSEILRRLVSQ